ncbi:UNVERIFIED_CONTAM: UbiD family decarboxylase, partial [Salmonella enterica subsp. enterica serovar Weltevreden]
VSDPLFLPFRGIVSSPELINGGTLALPLLLAIGSERDTPYSQTKQPSELLTIANHILGKGQLSLAKYLFITADDSNQLTTHDESAFYQYMLERINLKRDLHFQTNTSIDTL